MTDVDNAPDPGHKIACRPDGTLVFIPDNAADVDRLRAEGPLTCPGCGEQVTACAQRLNPSWGNYFRHEPGSKCTPDHSLHSLIQAAVADRLRAAGYPDTRIERTLSNDGRADVAVIVGGEVGATIEVQLAYQDDETTVARTNRYREVAGRVTWIYGVDNDGRALTDALGDGFTLHAWLTVQGEVMLEARTPADGAIASGPLSEWTYSIAHGWHHPDLDVAAILKDQAAREEARRLAEERELQALILREAVDELDANGGKEWRTYAGKLHADYLEDHKVRVFLDNPGPLPQEAWRYLTSPKDLGRTVRTPDTHHLGYLLVDEDLTLHPSGTLCWKQRTFQYIGGTATRFVGDGSTEQVDVVVSLPGPLGYGREVPVNTITLPAGFYDLSGDCVHERSVDLARDGGPTDLSVISVIRFFDMPTPQDTPSFLKDAKPVFEAGELHIHIPEGTPMSPRRPRTVVDGATLIDSRTGMYIEPVNEKVYVPNAWLRHAGQWSTTTGPVTLAHQEGLTYVEAGKAHLTPAGGPEGRPPLIPAPAWAPVAPVELTGRALLALLPTEDYTEVIVRDPATPA